MNHHVELMKYILSRMSRKDVEMYAIGQSMAMSAVADGTAVPGDNDEGMDGQFVPIVGLSQTDGEAIERTSMHVREQLEKFTREAN